MTNTEPRRVPWWQIIAVGRNPAFTLVRLIVLVALTFFVFRYLALPVRVTGISMLPGFKDGQRKFVNRTAYWFAEPQRGDVVAVRTTGLQNLYMKRVVGLPGERVRITRGTTHINDEPLDEPYVAKPNPRWRWPLDGSRERKLGPAEYLVVGDNRSMDVENHVFGVVPRERILGKVRQ